MDILDVHVDCIRNLVDMHKCVVHFWAHYEDGLVNEQLFNKHLIRLIRADVRPACHLYHEISYQLTHMDLEEKADAELKL